VGTLTLEGGRRFAFPDVADTKVHSERILRGQEYPPLVLPGFEPNDILDVGANIGAATLLFARVYPRARVFAVEPSATAFGFLVQNTEGLGNVRSFQIGLGERGGQGSLFLGRTQGLQNSLFAGPEVSSRTEPVEIRDAGPFLDQQGIVPVILKIDTEGCEIPILQSLGNRIESVDVLYLEYHSEADRREIDDRIRGQFDLIFARAKLVHRGTLVYISHRLLGRFPELGRWEIRRTT